MQSNLDAYASHNLHTVSKDNGEKPLCLGGEALSSTLFYRIYKSKEVRESAKTLNRSKTADQQLRRFEEETNLEEFTRYVQVAKDYEGTSTMF